MFLEYNKYWLVLLVYCFSCLFSVCFALVQELVYRFFFLVLKLVSILTHPQALDSVDKHGRKQRAFL